MNPLVVWTARALLAGWQRQEREGRYRGADDFRGLHIDPADALASWRAATAPVTPWPDDLADAFCALDVLPELGLTVAERLVVVLSVAVELEPRLRPLVSALSDDATTRSLTVGLAVELAGAAAADPRRVRAAGGPAARPVAYDLVRRVVVDGRPSGLDVVLLPTEWWVDAAAGTRALPAGVRLVRGRVVEDPGGGLDGIRAPASCLALRGADHVRHAEWVAARTVLAVHPAPEAVGALVRTGRLLGARAVVGVAEAPSAAMVEAISTLAGLGGSIAVSIPVGVHWVPPPAWTVVNVPPLTTPERAARWQSGLAALESRPIGQRTVDVDALARDYALGASGVDDALQRTAGGLDPRAAARATAWQDLTAVARPCRVAASWADLIVPAPVLDALRQIAAAISGRRVVLDDWGFGRRPGGRGYHVLFAGPSGTGKSLAASVIAHACDLELWIVDLARVVDKYLGETEKLLDRVLRAAEASGAMLLFDEADALFGRRGEVREARDRWANVEVAYLLQRIEAHDGVTVLTTNVSHHLDEAFARRMSRRVEFPMPDPGLRRRLWSRSIPADAPLLDRSDLDVVGDRFELAGGAIRNAAINAAYAAAADRAAITLPHLVRASVSELVKAGRAPTRADLGDLAALGQS